ncbi:MAG: sensor histidine kinase, partial [Lysobacteraceae bacterium]
MSPAAIARHLPAPLRHWLRPAPDSLAAEHQRLGKSAWSQAVHLLWSAWVFVTPAFGMGYDARWIALTCASYPLFLLLYAKVFVAPRRTMARYPVAMMLLAFALMPWYPSGISYYVFGCVMLPCRRGLPRYLLRLAVANLAFVALARWIGYTWEVWAWMPVMTMIIGVIVNVERAAHEQEAALKLSHDEVRRLAATAERERIGRDLHDLLGHTLSLITLKLELARKLSERDPAASRREMEEAERVARHALAEVRSAVTGIRSADLAAELASARLLLESSQVHLDYDAPPQGLPPEVERGLALLLREAVTNVAR